MADVTLVLRADNSDYIRKMKEAQQSSQKVYDTVERGSKKQKGLMEDIEDSINKYQTALKKATNIQDIEKYNRKIAEAKQHLNEYETAGVRANENIQKSSNKLMDSLTNLTKKYGLVSIAIAAITKIGRDLVQTFKDTTGGLNLMTAAGELWKQTIYNIITANQEWYQSSARSLMIGKMLNEQRKEDRKDLIETSKLREEYNQLYYESANRTKTNTERLEKMDEAMKIHNQLIDIELKNAYHQLVITEEQLVNRPKSNKLLNQEAELIARLNEIEGKRWSETKRLEGQRTALQKEIHDEMMQRYFDEIEANNKLQDEKLKAQEEFKNLAIKLIDEYDKAEIESLEGEEKLAAQRDYQLKAVILFREQMKKLAELTPEQEKMFAILGANVWGAYYKGLTGMGDDKWEAGQKGAKEIVEENKKLAHEAIKEYEEDEKRRQEIIDDEIKGNERLKESIVSLANKITDSIADIYSKRAEDAQRTRELYDTQISELQQDIDTQVELYKAGYASNVSLKLKELDTLKSARNRALADEQRALNQERAIELAIQSLNLATSITALFKDEIKSRGIYGLITGAVASAAFLILWSQYKSQAEASTKMAQGGSGTDTGVVKGRSHAAGGERFVDQIEVERGEAWGVLSVPATQKYGKIFHQMVSSFNHGDMPVIVPPASVTNRVLVNNDGSNSRLDRLIEENHELNEKLSRQSEYVQNLGGKTIYKKGDNIRIVR